MDIPTTCVFSFNLSNSSVRACSSAVAFSFRSQLPRDVSDHLEYHPEASRWKDATTAWDQVEEVPLQAAPEVSKSFLDISGGFVDKVAVSIHLLLQFDSDDDRLNKHYAMDAARGLCTFRA